MTNEQLEKAAKLADALPRLLELFSNRYGDKTFSRKFLLKHILGFTDEELAENEKWIIEEKADAEVRRKKIEAKIREKTANSDFEKDDVSVSDINEFRAEEYSPYTLRSTSRW